MVQYVTAQEFRDYPHGLGSALPGSVEAVDLLLQIASEFVDNNTGHGAGAFAAGSTSYSLAFDGNGKASLFLPFAVSISAVSISGAALPSGSWITYREGREAAAPICRITLTPFNTALAQSTTLFPTVGPLFPDGQQNVTVTAVWGYSATPPAGIKQAVILTAAGYIKARGTQAFAINQGAPTANPGGGGPNTRVVEDILGNYRRVVPL